MEMQIPADGRSRPEVAVQYANRRLRSGRPRQGLYLQHGSTVVEDG
jgi:hypothetical protein